MKKFLVGCGALLALVVLLVVGLYVATGVKGTFDVREARQRATAEAEHSLPDADDRAARLQRALRTQLGHGEPEYSWRELRCALETVDGGWIVLEYEQVCEVHTVDLFPAQEAPASGNCEDLPDPLDAAYPVVVTINHGPTQALTSENPWRALCPAGITETSLPGATTVVAGERPDDLSSSPAWIVAETRVDVSRTTLGCHPWKPVFCSAPVDHPVLPPPD